MRRRDFIQLTAALAGVGSSLFSCSPGHRIKGSIVGAGAATGHLLRDKKFTAPTEVINKDVVIIGGGISGLSAANYLHQHGVTDFLLLELEKNTGGNAAHGANEISAYPWGAHYLPIPNNNLTAYTTFLESCNVITGFDGNGLPIYNEQYLCFDPQERLYINGRWQDGLVPHFGVPEDELKQIERFLTQMNDYRYAKGRDGKDLFAIPVNESSKDEEIVKLDNITMAQWLTDNEYTSLYLHKYVNYCSRDDFGTPHNMISAWAGIHYYASRKGKGANAEHGDVLTWPEGNGFLVQKLRQHITNNILTQSLVFKVYPVVTGVRVEWLDVATDMVKAIDAKQCIMAVPQFVGSKLLNDEVRVAAAKNHFHYAPWMVANMIVRPLEERSGAPLSWDNVLHDSQSLGYVEATHELLEQHLSKRNLTYYMPLTQSDPATERKLARDKSHQDWVQMIIDDLKIVHPNIGSATEEINIMLWGHAMAQPLPGFIHGDIRSVMSQSVGRNIHFAHTDLAGISIFEEAFYQGLTAARKVIAEVI